MIHPKWVIWFASDARTDANLSITLMCAPVYLGPAHTLTHSHTHSHEPFLILCLKGVHVWHSFKPGTENVLQSV